MIICSLVETCKLNRIDPQRYLHYVLERIADHPINRIARERRYEHVVRVDCPQHLGIKHLVYCET